jgi:hypothetical protein
LGEAVVILSFRDLLILGVGMMVLSGSAAGCARKPVGNSEGAPKMTPKTIEQVLKAHTEEWMAVPGVVGTAIGEFKGRPCIRVFVVKKNEALKKKIPSRVEGFPVKIEETGEIRALEKS